MTEMNPMPVDSTRAMGDFGSGWLRRMVRSFAYHWVKPVMATSAPSAMNAMSGIPRIWQSPWI